MSTNTETAERASRLTWPLRFAWRRVTAFSERVGILRTLILGAILTVLGYILMSTIIGALIGIPMFIVGLVLLVRGLY